MTLDYDSNEIRPWIASFLVYLTKYLCIKKSSSPLKQQSEVNTAQHFFSSYRYKELKCHRNTLLRIKIFSQPSLTFLKKVKISVGFEHGIAKNWMLVINGKEYKSSSNLKILISIHCNEISKSQTPFRFVILK